MAICPDFKHVRVTLKANMITATTKTIFQSSWNKQFSPPLDSDVLFFGKKKEKNNSVKGCQSFNIKETANVDLNLHGVITSKSTS